MAILEREPDREDPEDRFQVEQLPLGFSHEMLSVLTSSSTTALNKGRQEIYPLDLFIGLVRGSNVIKQALVELNIPVVDLMEKLERGNVFPQRFIHEETVFTPLTYQLILNAITIGRSAKSPRLESIHLLDSFAHWNQGNIPHILQVHYGRNLQEIYGRTKRIMQTDAV